MILSMSHDIRVLLVKLADRGHNMRTLEFMEPASRSASPGRPWISTPPGRRLGMFRSRPSWKTYLLLSGAEAYQQIQEAWPGRRAPGEIQPGDVSVPPEKLEEHHIKGK